MFIIIVLFIHDRTIAVNNVEENKWICFVFKWNKHEIVISNPLHFFLTLFRHFVLRFCYIDTVSRQNNDMFIIWMLNKWTMSWTFQINSFVAAFFIYYNLLCFVMPKCQSVKLFFFVHLECHSYLWHCNFSPDIILSNDFFFVVKIIAANVYYLEMWNVFNVSSSWRHFVNSSFKTHRRKNVLGLKLRKV